MRLASARLWDELFDYQRHLSCSSWWTWKGSDYMNLDTLNEWSVKFAAHLTQVKEGSEGILRWVMKGKQVKWGRRWTWSRKDYGWWVEIGRRDSISHLTQGVIGWERERWDNNWNNQSLIMKKQCKHDNRKMLWAVCNWDRNHKSEEEEGEKTTLDNVMKNLWSVINSKFQGEKGDSVQWPFSLHCE